MAYSRYNICSYCKNNNGLMALFPLDDFGLRWAKDPRHSETKLPKSAISRRMRPTLILSNTSPKTPVEFDRGGRVSCYLSRCELEPRFRWRLDAILHQYTLLAAQQSLYCMGICCHEIAVGMASPPLPIVNCFNARQ